MNMDGFLNVDKFTTYLEDNFFENKTILVTGGCGFLGSWICKTILNMRGKIICVDNLSTSSMNNLNSLKDLKNFEFINKDIKELDIEILPKSDLIFHFASRAAPDNYKLHPIDTLETNSFGTKKMLEYSRKYNSTFVFSSTSEIYGNPTVIPTSETYYGYVNTIGERSCYDEGKRYAESLIHAYVQEYNVDTRILRIFNTYGPGIRPDGSYGRAVSRFILQCLKNEPITIYGDGSNTRSFNYITDTLSGIFSVLKEETFRGRPVNIGNNQEVTILELADLIKKLTKSQSEIKFLPETPDDPNRRCPDTTLLKSTGWKQEIELEKGLEKTIEWIQKHYV